MEQPTPAPINAAHAASIVFLCAQPDANATVSPVFFRQQRTFRFAHELFQKFQPCGRASQPKEEGTEIGDSSSRGGGIGNVNCGRHEDDDECITIQEWLHVLVGSVPEAEKRHFVNTYLALVPDIILDFMPNLEFLPLPFFESCNMQKLMSRAGPGGSNAIVLAAMNGFTGTVKALHRLWKTDIDAIDSSCFGNGGSRPIAGLEDILRLCDSGMMPLLRALQGEGPREIDPEFVEERVRYLQQQWLSLAIYLRNEIKSAATTSRPSAATSTVIEAVPESAIVSLDSLTVFEVVDVLEAKVGQVTSGTVSQLRRPSPSSDVNKAYDMWERGVAPVAVVCQAIQLASHASHQASADALTAMRFRSNLMLSPHEPEATQGSNHDRSENAGPRATECPQVPRSITKSKADQIQAAGLSMESVAAVHDPILRLAERSRYRSRPYCGGCGRVVCVSLCPACSTTAFCQGSAFGCTNQVLRNNAHRGSHSGGHWHWCRRIQLAVQLQERVSRSVLDSLVVRGNLGPLLSPAAPGMHAIAIKQRLELISERITSANLDDGRTAAREQQKRNSLVSVFTRLLCVHGSDCACGSAHSSTFALKLQSAKSWKEVFCAVHELGAEIPSEHSLHSMRSTFASVSYVVLSDLLGPVFTVADSLRRHGLGNASDIRIHIVGADRECNRPWLLLGILLPALVNLELIFVGPELHHTCPAKSVTYQLHTVSSASASPGMSRPRVATCSFHQALYHDFIAKQSGIHSAPDLVVLLNPGIHYYTSWRPTIRCILNGRNFSSRGHDNPKITPAVFTSWAMPEAVMTHHILDEQVAKTQGQLSLPHINPWSSLLPRISPDNNCLCQFNDHYVTHFSGSSHLSGPDIVGHEPKSVSASNQGSSKRVRLSLRKPKDLQQLPAQGGSGKDPFTFNFFETAADDDDTQPIASHVAGNKQAGIAGNDLKPNNASTANGCSAWEATELTSSNVVTKHEGSNERLPTLPSGKPKAFSFNFFGHENDAAASDSDLESEVAGQASSRSGTANDLPLAKRKDAAKGFAFNFFE